MATIEPCRDEQQLREYIDTYWRKGHVLARDERMFAFQYKTQWVDRSIFPAGVSVLCAYEGDTPGPGRRLLGFLGAIVAPYPRPQSYWLALWHVLPELKGGGQGGKLLQMMQEIAVGPDGRGAGWIGTFGAGPEALPVYLKRGYACRAVRRWVWGGGKPEPGQPAPQQRPVFAKHSAEALASEAWDQHRYVNHPIYKYDMRAGGVFRTETNEWGVVTHCCRLNEGTTHWRDDVTSIAAKECEAAARSGRKYMMDAWAFDTPGPGWSLAADDLPSVFHPPMARGNLIYAVGRPFVPTTVSKGDCDQDRPN